MWSIGDVVGVDAITESIVDWLSEKGFAFLNEKGVIAHPARHCGERPSVIDLKFANEPAIANDVIQEWAIDTDIARMSDRYGIHFTIDHGRKETDNLYGVKYSLKNVEPQDWVRAFDDELTKLQDIEDIANQDNPTHDNLERYAGVLTQVIQNATAERKPSPHAKPWWDRELSDLSMKIAEARRAQKELGEQFSRTIQSRIIRSRHFFKKLCKYKKTAWASEKLQNAKSTEIWSFPNWSKGIRNYPTPPISRGDGRPKATTHEEKCEALREELSQVPPRP